MKTKLTLLTLLLTIAVGLWAQNATPRLVVWLKSGEKVYFDLAAEPKTRFNNGLLIISSNDKTLETSYQLSNVLRYTHEGVCTDVNETKTHDLTVAQTKDGITLKNVPAGTPVRLYNPAGHLLETKTSNGTSAVQFSLAAHPAGVYLVNLNDQTFKITKR